MFVSKVFLALRLISNLNLQELMKKMFVAIMAVTAITFASCGGTATEESTDAQNQADTLTEELMDDMNEAAEDVNAEMDTLEAEMDTLKSEM